MHAILTPDNCVYEMERVIATAMANRQPAYIIVAEDLATRPITGPAACEQYPEPQSDADELKAAVDAALAKIQAAKTGCILPAFTVSRFGLQAEVTALIEASGLPFATTAMDKAALSEGHPSVHWRLRRQVLSPQRLRGGRRERCRDQRRRSPVHRYLHGRVCGQH